MADPASQPSTAVSEQLPADRDVRIEQLLLSGLDHYFRGQFERAIDVWTRVLFLDRDHPRARAYIERARAAVAERLRESEAFLQAGVEACERGDVDEARALLNGAIERGGPRDTALSVLDRVERLDTGAVEAPSRAAVRRADTRRARRGTDPDPGARRTTMVPWLLLVGGLVAAGSWWYGNPMLWTSVASGFGASPLRSAAPVPSTPGPLPVPTAPELALERAESLAAEGRYADALEALSHVGFGDGVRADVDRVRADLQRAVLGEVPPSLTTGRQAVGAGQGRESGRP